jgi:hypothetical protein
MSRSVLSVFCAVSVATVFIVWSAPSPARVVPPEQGSTASADETSPATLRPIPWRNPAMTEFAAAAPSSAANVAHKLAELAGRPDEHHALLQFTQPVDDAQRSALQAAGVTLLAYVGENGFFAALDETGFDETAISAVTTLARAEAIRPESKIHPLFLAPQPPQHAIVGESPDAGTWVAAYLIFHPDVPLATSGIPVLLQYGVVVRDTITVVN